MEKSSILSGDLFSFLRDLEVNNNKKWFEANKKRYEESVKLPALSFISAFSPHLHKISPHFLAIPRSQGGSLFRIYRDLRFGKDKTPYKTNTGLHFRHEAGRDAHAPGFYVHLAPDEVFFAAGLWKPVAPVAGAIRQLIVDEPDEWTKVAVAMDKAQFQFAGDSLKRPPRNFDAKHPHIQDIMRKDFTVSLELDEKAAVSPDFLEQIAHCSAQAAPLMKFLCRAVDVPF